MSCLYLSTSKEEIIIPSNAIRFRIIASSNTLDNQLTKEKIKRDIINNVLPNLDDSDIDNSIKNNLSNIKDILNNYDVEYDISYGNNYFPTKTYKGITYQEGYYKSLVITLGDGLGDNFWCVMYPPLCLIDNTDEITYKSKVVELIKKYS